MKKSVLALLLLTGCATLFPKYEDKLNTFIGRPLTEIISANGIPTKTMKINETTEIDEWATQSNSYSTTSNYGIMNTRENVHGCVTDLTVVNGLVEKYSYRGNDCR